MSIEAPYPGLSELLEMVGEAGVRVSEIGASEGAAGNISVCFKWDVEPRRVFTHHEVIKLPWTVPDLAGYSLIVTGSGRRLREVINQPELHVGFVRVLPGGETADLYTSPNKRFERLTSEFNSHLSIHQDQVRQTGTNFHAVVHGQPTHLTYLSHIAGYQDETFLNKHLLRWQPELIINLPEGIGVVPFCVPGSNDLMAGTVECLRGHRIVLWCHHGVVARSDISVKRAADRVEYAETAARYEYLNLCNHEQASGLSVEQIRAICKAFNIQQAIF